MLAYCSCLSSDHKLGDLEQQKCIPSKFWRPGVQNQGACKAVLSREAGSEGAEGMGARGRATMVHGYRCSCGCIIAASASAITWPSPLSSPLACLHAKSLRLCLTLCDPMDCSPPGSPVHGLLQTRVLEWVAMPPQGIFPTRG